jgi:beta-phosphoglucomutase-like phosphatase (HAD superfamily)
MPTEIRSPFNSWDIDYNQTIGLIFDVDELLIDNSREIYSAYCSLLEVRNIPLDPRETFPGKDLFEIINAIKIKYAISDTCEDLVLERRNKYIELLKVKHGILNPGVKDVLHFFEQNRDQLNLRIAYASSSEKGFIEIILKGIFRDCGLEMYIQDPESFFSFNGGQSASTCWEPGLEKKPSPMIYNRTLEKIGLKTQQCIAFEDSKSGVEAALMAGLHVYVVPSFANREYFNSVLSSGNIDPRMQILSSLRDILPVLASLPTASGVGLSENV